MKAIRVHEFGPPSVMKLESVADPEPTPGHVVVSVRAAGVNPVDTYIRAGTYAKKPALPYTPGFDAAGIIDSVGAGVKQFKAGDRVYINGNVTGAYAEKVLCAEDSVFPLPEKLNFAEGAGIWVPYATAHFAIFEAAKALPGETLLVHGASGGVGSAAVQTARAWGMRVLGSAGTETGLQLVQKLGAQALNHHDPKFAEQVADLTNGRGPDIILEMLANVNLSKDLAIIARRGRIVVIGNRGTIEINPRDAMAKGASVIGMLLLNCTGDETRRISAAIGAGLESGSLKPIVGREFELHEAPRAHEAVLASGALGKIALIP